MSNNMYNYTYPLVDQQIKDESAGTQQSVPLNLPLSLPLVPLRAADGPVNVIDYYVGNSAISTFGEPTFDKFSPYYRNEQTYLEDCILPNGGALIVRLCDPKAKKATMVVECALTKNVQVQMYERDAKGNIVYGEQGKPKPKMDEGNNPVKEPGVKVRFTTRALTEDEVPGQIQPKTTQVGEETVTTYPLWDTQYKSPGKCGNNHGMKFYCDRLNQNEDVVEENGGALMYTFAPMKIPHGSNVAVAVTDKFGYVSNSMFVKPNTIDSDTQRRMSTTDVIDRVYYNSNTKVNYLPFDINFYTDNFKEIGEAVKEVETNDIDIKDGWGVDILTFLNKNGIQYHHVVMDTKTAGSIQMSSFSVVYMQDGDDGDTSDDMFEDLYRQLLNYELIPELQDYFKYPITHIYDVGYSIDTTLALASFIGKHPRCKVVLAAQDSARPLYTMDEAVSASNTIRARAALTPESVFYGTPALRAEIFAQAGYLKDNTVKNIIPSTYWICLRRSQLHSGRVISGTVKGDPNNIVDIYRKDNFTPYSPDQKQLLWDGAANYYQHKDLLTKFFPDVATVYTKKSSVLSDTTYTDACVYLMYIVDRVWTRHASRTVPIAVMQNDIKEEIEREANRVLNSMFSVVAEVYLTAEDIERGEQCHIKTTMTGYSPMRRWYNTIISRRENFNAVAVY